MDGADINSVASNESARSIHYIQDIARPSIVDTKRPSRSHSAIRHIMKTGSTPSEVIAHANALEQANATRGQKLHFSSSGGVAEPQQAPQQAAMAITPHDSVSQAPYRAAEAPLRAALPEAPHQNVMEESYATEEEEEESGFMNMVHAQDPPGVAYANPPQRYLPPSPPQQHLPPSPRAPPPQYLPPSPSPQAPPPQYMPAEPTYEQLMEAARGQPDAAPMAPVLSPYDLEIEEEDEYETKMGYLTEIYELRLAMSLPPTTLTSESSIKVLRTEFDLMQRQYITNNYSNIGMGLIGGMLHAVESGAEKIGMDIKGFRDNAITDPTYRYSVRRAVRTYFASRGPSNPLVDIAISTATNLATAISQGSKACRHAGQPNLVGVGLDAAVSVSSMQSRPHAVEPVPGAVVAPPADVTDNPMAAFGGNMPEGAMEMMNNPEMMAMAQNFLQQPGAMDTLSKVMSGGTMSETNIAATATATSSQRSAARMSGPE